MKLFPTKTQIRPIPAPLHSFFSRCMLAFFIISFFLLSAPAALAASTQNKIVGLIQARNEQETIEQCLRGLAVYTDAIVLLDDNSDDNTLKIARALAQELHIEHIIAQPYSGWQKTSEADNRQTLLDAGRAIGGTHFILIDADELFMAPCAQDNWLRNKILSLKKGQVLAFPMVNVWGSVYQYRDDEWCSPRQGVWRHKPIAFCDDQRCNYVNLPTKVAATKMLHGSRVPINCTYAKHELVHELYHGIIHFKWANLHNIRLKKVWYMMLEFIRVNELHPDKERNFKRVVQYYNKTEFKGMQADQKDITLKPVPASWYNYPFFNPESYMALNSSRKKDIALWIEQYGADYFTGFLRAAPILNTQK